MIKIFLSSGRSDSPPLLSGNVSLSGHIDNADHTTYLTIFTCFSAQGYSEIGFFDDFATIGRHKGLWIINNGKDGDTLATEARENTNISGSPAVFHELTTDATSTIFRGLPECIRPLRLEA